MATGLTVEKVLKTHTEKISMLIHYLLKKAFNNDEILKELIGIHNLELIDDDLNMLTKVDTDFELINGDNTMAFFSCYLRGHAGYPGGEFNKDLHKIEFWVEISALTLILAMYTEEINETSKEIRKYANY